MRRRGFIKAGIGSVTLAGCNEDTGNASQTPTPVPYEFPDGVTEAGIHETGRLASRSAEESVSNSARMDSVMDPEDRRRLERVLKVDSKALLLKEDGYDGEIKETYLHPEDDVGMGRQKTPGGDVSYTDHSDALDDIDGDTLVVVAMRAIGEGLVAIGNFDYKFIKGVMYQDRVAGRFESQELSDHGEIHYASGESEVFVGESGWILGHGYQLDDGSITIDFDFEFSGIGATPVTEPDWLEEAQQST